MSMERLPIPLEKWTSNAYGLWEKQWLLLSCGDYASADFNCMTVSWGSLGVMWNKPFAQVVVRPVRYTFQFMEKYPTFTLCAFPKIYRNALNVLGTLSGRDSHKLEKSGLTPEAATQVAAPVYEQAELAIECRKIYWQDFDPSHFIDPELNKHYPKKDYHRIYFGEIVAVTGIEKYFE
jgi:flavin reductase (DIM6/NTAB) family NADH-FMN oxidoreductase RutF